MAETVHASRPLKTIGELHRISIAPIGNMVEQLHIHIVIRTKVGLGPDAGLAIQRGPLVNATKALLQQFEGGSAF